jgi:hypothetical protein
LTITSTLEGAFFSSFHKFRKWLRQGGGEGSGIEKVNGQTWPIKMVVYSDTDTNNSSGGTSQCVRVQV